MIDEAACAILDIAGPRISGDGASILKGSGMNDNIEKAEFVKGLRDLADFFDANPEMIDEYDYVIINHQFWGAWEKEEFGREGLELLRAGGTKFDEENQYGVRKHFGPHRFTVSASHDSVCEKKVVGTMTKPALSDEQVAELKALREAQDAIRANPAGTKDEEIVEWECPPSFISMAERAEES